MGAAEVGCWGTAQVAAALPLPCPCPALACRDITPTCRPPPVLSPTRPPPSDPLGAYVASACRAQSADAAAIWLWGTERWTGVAQLPAHTLTVTQLAFSPDGRYLASASRDRTVALFERQQGAAGAAAGGDGTAAAAAAAAAGEAAAAGAAPFRLVGRLKAHARIVWGLHWSPDSRLLATASRDGKGALCSRGPLRLRLGDSSAWRLPIEPAGVLRELQLAGAARALLQSAWPHSPAHPGLPFAAPAVKVWSLGPGGELPAAPAAAIDCGDSVRSVQFAPACGPGATYHLAAGLEGGEVQLLRLEAAPAGSAADGAGTGGSQTQLAIARHKLVWRSPAWERHAAAVRRLCWRADEEAGPGCCQLASVSDDHALRVFAVRL